MATAASLITTEYPSEDDPDDSTYTMETDPESEEIETGESENEETEGSPPTAEPGA